LIGSGVVVYVPAFFKELEDLEAKGLSDVRSRIFISDRSHVVFDLHQLVDGLEEVELGSASVGTTRKGIGPTYSTKAARSGVRISEIFNEELFNKKLRKLADGYKKRYGDLLNYDVEVEIAKFNVCQCAAPKRTKIF
jgi:adenylosuccinate synthase